MADENLDPSAVTDSGGRGDPGVEVDAGADEVWRAVSRPRGGPSGSTTPTPRSRRVRRRRGRRPADRLVWTWWRPGDEGGASTVAVVLAPTLAAAPGSWSPSRSGGPGRRRRMPVARAGRRSPVGLRADRWSHRLLGPRAAVRGRPAGVPGVR